MAITPKVKKPILSDRMLKVIDRSIYNKKDSPYDDVIRYKYKIMDLLTSNEDILRTLNNADFDDGTNELNGDNYRDTCIFSYMKLPDLKDKVKNYICFDVFIAGQGVIATDTIKFMVVSHVDDVKTDYGINRQDLLAAIIKQEFNWSNEMGKTLNLTNDTYGYASEGYYYREITYQVTNPNDIYNKINPRR
jgi:hypothetical protein